MSEAEKLCREVDKEASLQMLYGVQASISQVPEQEFDPALAIKIKVRGRTIQDDRRDGDLMASEIYVLLP